MYFGTDEATDFRFGARPVIALKVGATHVWGTDLNPPVSDGVAIAAVTGDSTVAAYLGGSAVSSFVADMTETDIAVPGHTVAQQVTLWNAIPDKTIFEAVFVQIGLNDVTNSGTSAGAISAIQSYVNLISSDVSPSCKIIISQMLPCAQRWYDLFGLSGGAIAYAHWQEMNEAIGGAGPSPITGVDARVTAHVPLLASTLTLNYGSGDFSQPNCLNPIYEAAADHIHENNAARAIIADAWRDELVTLGVLTV